MANLRPGKYRAHDLKTEYNGYPVYAARCGDELTQAPNNKQIAVATGQKVTVKNKRLLDPSKLENPEFDVYAVHPCKIFVPEKHLAAALGVQHAGYPVLFEGCNECEEGRITICCPQPIPRRLWVTPTILEGCTDVVVESFPIDWQETSDPLQPFYTGTSGTFGLELLFDSRFEFPCIVAAQLLCGDSRFTQAYSGQMTSCQPFMAEFQYIFGPSDPWCCGGSGTLQLLITE